MNKTFSMDFHGLAQRMDMDAWQIICAPLDNSSENAGEVIPTAQRTGGDEDEILVEEEVVIESHGKSKELYESVGGGGSSGKGSSSIDPGSLV